MINKVITRKREIEDDVESNQITMKEKKGVPLAGDIAQDRFFSRNLITPEKKISKQSNSN